MLNIDIDRYRREFGKLLLPSYLGATCMETTTFCNTRCNTPFLQLPIFSFGFNNLYILVVVYCALYKRVFVHFCVNCHHRTNVLVTARHSADKLDVLVLKLDRVAR